MTIKRMQRLPSFEHHIICDIDHVAYAANSHSFQPESQPIGTWTDFDPANNARGVTRTQLGILDPHRDQTFNIACGYWVRNFGHFEQASAYRGYFPSDANDAVPVRTIRSDFQIIHDIATRAPKILGEWLSNERIF